MCVRVWVGVRGCVVCLCVCLACQDCVYVYMCLGLEDVYGICVEYVCDVSNTAVFGLVTRYFIYFCLFRKAGWLLAPELAAKRYQEETGRPSSDSQPRGQPGGGVSRSSPLVGADRWDGGPCHDTAIWAVGHFWCFLGTLL